MVEVIQRKVAIMQFYKSLRQAVNNQTILSCYFKALRGCMGTIILQNIKLKMITPQIFFKSTCFKVKLERPCTCAVIQMNTFKTFKSGIKWDHKKTGENSIAFLRKSGL